MTNPTLEQIEAARAEYALSEDMCAALVAAAGAAPQEPSGCICTWHSEDRGGGYSELVIEPEPDCAEHGDGIAAAVQVDEAKLIDAIAEELNTDDWIAEEWSNGKLNATARRLVDFAVMPVLRGGGQ